MLSLSLLSLEMSPGLLLLSQLRNAASVTLAVYTPQMQVGLAASSLPVVRHQHACLDNCAASVSRSELVPRCYLVVQTNVVSSRPHNHTLAQQEQLLPEQDRPWHCISATQRTISQQEQAAAASHGVICTECAGRPTAVLL